jgi:hypothetical protein
LIDYLRFYVPLKNISLKYGDVTIAGEGLQKFKPMLGAQGHRAGRDLYRASVFSVSSEGPPNSVASYDKQGEVEDLL